MGNGAFKLEEGKVWWLGQSLRDAPVAIEPGHRLRSATSHHFLVTKCLIFGRVKIE